MESILARALEYTLKYWLKSFSRDQFKLQGRTVQLSNLGGFRCWLARFDSFLWIGLSCLGVDCVWFCLHFFQI